MIATWNHTRFHDCMTFLFSKFRHNGNPVFRQGAIHSMRTLSPKTTSVEQRKHRSCLWLMGLLEYPMCLVQSQQLSDCSTPNWLKQIHCDCVAVKLLIQVVCQFATAQLCNCGTAQLLKFRTLLTGYSRNRMRHLPLRASVAFLRLASRPNRWNRE